MEVIIETSNGRQFAMEIWFFATVREIKENIQRYEGYPVPNQKLFFRCQELDDDHSTERYDILQGSRLQLILLADPAGGGPGRVHVVRESDGVAPPTNRPFALLRGSADVDRLLQDDRAALFPDYGAVVAHHPEAKAVAPRPFPPAPPVASAPKRLKLLVLPRCGTKRIPVEVNASDNVSELKKELQRLHAHLQFHLPSEGYFFIYRQNVMDDDRTFRWHDVRQGDTIEIFNGTVTGGY